MRHYALLIVVLILSACAPYQALMIDKQGEMYMCLSDRTIPVIARHQINSCITKMERQGYSIQGEIKQ